MQRGRLFRIESPMEPTQVDRALAALEEQHANDPERVEVLRRTRRFKSSWLQLGEALSEVKRDKTWERWGHASFEIYAKVELKLRMETVDKLTGSYMFLHKSAPEVLQRDPLEGHLPSYQAIDFLRRAEERNREENTVPDSTMEEVRNKILDEGVPMATVARLYKDSLFPVSPADKKAKDLKELKTMASKLRDILTGTDAISHRLSASIASVLEELLSELADNAKAA